MSRLVLLVFDDTYESSLSVKIEESLSRERWREEIYFRLFGIYVD